MKAGGKSSLVRNSKPLTFNLPDGTEMVLTLTALPLGWREKIARIKTFALPDVPREVVKTAAGKVQRGDDGLAVMAENENDPEYLAKLAQIGLRLKAVRVREILRYDPTVEFEAVQPDGDDADKWAAYSDALVKEFTEFGLTDVELTVIEQLGDKLSVRIDMDEARKSFLSESKE
jgi:hypothetical protein